MIILGTVVSSIAIESTKFWIRRIIPEENFTAVDRTILDISRKFREECVKILENAIEKKELTEKELFSILYFPETPVSDPPKFTTFYDSYTDKKITPLEDRFLGLNKKLIFVILVDKNGYVPSHNSKFSKPRTGDIAYDIKNCRTKRIFNDITGFSAAKNNSDFLLQIYLRDTGEIISDLSMPVFINAIRWGSVRSGYRGERD